MEILLSILYRELFSSEFSIFCSFEINMYLLYKYLRIDNKIKYLFFFYKLRFGSDEME